MTDTTVYPPLSRLACLLARQAAHEHVAVGGICVTGTSTAGGPPPSTSYPQVGTRTAGAGTM